MAVPDLDPAAWALLVAVALAALLLGAMVWRRRRRRTRELVERFGPEYEHAVRQTGGRRSAEADLAQRLELREQLEIRPLAAPVRRRYSESWQRVQLRFVDSPSEAVRDAQRLVDDLLRERGYAFSEFEQRADAFSVDYPHLAVRYREAFHLPLDPEAHPPRTEELRQVLLDYRLMLQELLEKPPGEADDEEHGALAASHPSPPPAA